MELLSNLENADSWFNDIFPSLSSFVEEEIISNNYKDDLLVKPIPTKGSIQLPYINEEGKHIMGVGIIIPSDKEYSLSKYVKTKKRMYSTKGGRKDVYTYMVYKNLGQNASGDFVFVRLPIKGETNKLFEMGINTDETIILDNILVDSNQKPLPKDYKEYIKSMVDKTTEEIRNQQEALTSEDEDILSEFREPETTEETTTAKVNTVENIEVSWEEYSKLPNADLTEEEFNSLTPEEQKEVIKQLKEC